MGLRLEALLTSSSLQPRSHRMVVLSSLSVTPHKCTYMAWPAALASLPTCAADLSTLRHAFSCTSHGVGALPASFYTAFSPSGSKFAVASQDSKKVWLRVGRTPPQADGGFTTDRSHAPPGWMSVQPVTPAGGCTRTRGIGPCWDIGHQAGE